MSTDTRIQNTLPQHQKTRKLIKKLGQQAGWNLVCLFIYTTANKPDGVLNNMTVEDVELVADWQGDDGVLVEQLIAVGFLDVIKDGFVVHDWTQHNPWASGQTMRSAKARWNAIYRYYGEKQADEQVPEYAKVRVRNDASSNASSNAPSPTPKPIKKDKKNTLVRFDEFWAVYPRKDVKLKSQQAWQKNKCDDIADEVISGAKRYAESKIGGDAKFIAMASTWLNGNRWTDGDSGSTDDLGSYV